MNDKTKKSFSTQQDTKRELKRLSVQDAWAHLVPISNNLKQIELTSGITNLSIINGELNISIDNIQNNYFPNVEDINVPIQIIKCIDKQSSTIIKVMNNNLKLFIFNKHIAYGEQIKIEQGDLLKIQFRKGNKQEQIEYIYTEEQKEEIKILSNQINDKGLSDENTALKSRIEFIKKADENFENELNCPICLELMHNPFTIISCLHSFCGDCMTKAVFANQKFNNNCPFCRSEIDDVKQNPLLSSSIEKHLLLYPELKKEASYYTRKNQENQCNLIHQLKQQQNQNWQPKPLYILRNRDDSPGYEILGFLFSLILYYSINCALKKINGF